MPTCPAVAMLHRPPHQQLVSVKLTVYNMFFSLSTGQVEFQPTQGTKSIPGMRLFPLQREIREDPVIVERNKRRFYEGCVPVVTSCVAAHLDEKRTPDMCKYSMCRLGFVSGVLIDITTVLYRQFVNM